MRCTNVYLIWALLLLMFCNAFAQAPEWTWARQAGGANIDEGVSIAMDSSGNSYITGNFLGTALFGTISLTSTSTGFRDVFVAKMSPTGTWLWAKKAGGTGDDRVNSIAVDASGNAYITGFYNSSRINFTTSIYLNRNGTSTNNDMFVAKINSSGTWQWARKNNTGSDTDIGSAIAVDTSSNVYLTGSFSSTVTIGNNTLSSSGWSDIFVAKLDTAGAWQWAVKAGGSSLDNGFGIVADGSGGAYVCGSFSSHPVTFGVLPPISGYSGADTFVARISASGSWTWVTTAGGSGYDTANSIILNSDGNLYVTGSFDSSTITFAPGITLTRNGSSSNNDIFVARLNTSGNWSWARKAGGIGWDQGLSIAGGGDSNVYITGRTTCPSAFGTTTLLSTPVASSMDAFAAKIDTAGDWQWAKQIGYAGSETGSGIAVDGNNVHLAGYFEQSVVFSGTTLTSAGLADIFLGKLGTMIMTYPNGGESFTANSTQNILWNAPGVNSVFLEYNVDGGDTWQALTVGAPVPAGLGTFAWTVPQINSSQVLMRIRDSAGSAYDVSDATFNIISTTQLPAAPTALSATVISSSQINLSWTDNSSNETGFKIERKTGASGTWAQLATVAANVSSYNNTGLTQSTSYYYRVRAYNSSGDSGYSNETSATTPSTTPNAPTGLTATTVSSSQINLAWTDNATNETGFKIERKTGVAGTWAQITTVSTNVSSYNNTNLSQNTIYYYRVRSYNANGDSDYSNEANATTTYTTPGTPTGLTATTASSSQINLSWTDNTSVETGYKIERKTGASGTYVQIATVSANVTTYSSTGLTQNTVYYYRVRAYNVSVNSAYSNEANATTLYTTPAAPTALTATAISASQIDLRWTDNTSVETGFSIERKQGVAGSYSQIATVNANVTAYSDVDLIQGSTYYYRVRAFNVSVYSGYSNEANATPVMPPIVEFSGSPTDGYIPLGVQFTDASTPGSGQIVSRAWSFGDGSTSTEQNPYHAYTAAGTYSVSLAVTNSYAVSTTLTRNNYIQANQIVPPVAQFSANVTSGYGTLDVQFSDVSIPGSGAIVSRAWTFGDGSTSTEQNPFHTYAELGTYTVSITVWDANQLSNTITQSDYITVLPHYSQLTPLSTSISFSDTFIGNLSEYNPLIITNTGTLPIDILDVHFQGSASHFVLNLPQSGFSNILPGATDTLYVRFAPQIPGAVRDTLCIVNTSANQPECKTGLYGVALVSPPLPPQNVVSELVETDVQLVWDAVWQNMLGEQIETDFYLVYINTIDSDVGFVFHGLTTEPEFVHTYAILAAEKMFYRVRAVKLYGVEPSPRGTEVEDYLRDKLKQGMSEAEVSRILAEAEEFF